MKYRFLWSFILAGILSITIHAMEPVQREEQAPFPSQELTPELKQSILLFLTSAPTLKEAVRNIKNFMILDKSFAAFLYNPEASSAIIKLLANHPEANGNLFTAALALNTMGAHQWMIHAMHDNKIINNAKQLSNFIKVVPESEKIVMVNSTMPTLELTIPLLMIINSLSDRAILLVQDNVWTDLVTFININIENLVALHPNFAQIFSLPRLSVIFTQFIAPALMARFAHTLFNASQMFRNHHQSVTAVNFLDSTHLATGSLDGTIRLIDLTTGNSNTIQNAGQVYAMVSPNPSVLFVASSLHNNINIYHTATGTLEGTMHPGNNFSHTQKINALATLGNYIYSVAQDGKVVRLDPSVLENGGMIISFPGSPSLDSITMASPDRLFILSKQTKIIYILRRVSAISTEISDIRDMGDVESIIASGKNTLICGLTNGRIKYIHIDSGKSFLSQEQQSSPIKFLSLMNNKLISGGQDGTISIWQVNSGVPLLSFNSHNGPLTSLTSFISNPYFMNIAAGFADGSVYVYKFDSTEFIKQISKDRDLKSIEASVYKMLPIKKNQLLSVEQALAIQ